MNEKVKTIVMFLVDLFLRGEPGIMNYDGRSEIKVSKPILSTHSEIKNLCRRFNGKTLSDITNEDIDNFREVIKRGLSKERIKYELNDIDDFRQCFQQPYKFISESSITKNDYNEVIEQLFPDHIYIEIKF